jgi:glycerophosphoryl diester phosphodiesterase
MNLRFLPRKVLYAGIAAVIAMALGDVVPRVADDLAGEWGGELRSGHPIASLFGRLVSRAHAATPAKGRAAASSWRHRAAGRTLIIAHRGFSAAYPDNSREGFEGAIAAGADLIETDVRMSRDNFLVLSHDGDIDAFSDIADLTAKELAAQSYVGLGELLKMVKGRAGVLLDIKLDEVDFPAFVLKEVKRLGMEGQVVFGLRELAQVRRLRKSAPDVMILGFFRDYGEYPAFFAAGGDIARLWEEDIDARTLALARDASGAGRERPVWVTTRLRTLGESAGEIDPPRLRKLMEMGIDGLLVNDPVQAVDVRAELKDRRRPQAE